MPSWYDDQERSEDDPDFDEAEEAADGEDEESTVPCPHCRREIHEDSERCPYCERYLSREDSPPARKPWWMILGVVACLYVVYRWVVLH